MHVSELPEGQRAFIERTTSAAMITVGADGMAKPVRIGITVVDGKLWSSGTADRVRTRRLRNDPRSTLFVFDAGYAWLGLETSVRLLEGPEAIEQSVRMFRLMQNRPTGPLTWFGGEHEEAEFAEILRREGRLLYEFDIQKAYGMA